MIDPLAREIELIAKAKQGDISAFEALYHKHKSSIYRTALGVVGNKQIAEEVLQEVFLRAYKNLHKIHPDVSLAPWLHRVTVNLAYDLSARQQRGLTILQRINDWLSPPSKSPEHSLEEQELQAWVLQAINQLEFKQRTTLVLFYLQGFSMQEIAEIMECPVGTVKSRLHYARLNLKHALVSSQFALGDIIYDLP